MSEGGGIQLKGTVIEAVSSTKIRVMLSNGEIKMVGVSGKIRLEFTRILPGNEVSVEFSPYDLSKGKIVGITARSSS